LHISHNDVVDPALYSDELRLHQMLAELRHNEPVRWTAPSDYRPFFGVRPRGTSAVLDGAYYNGSSFVAIRHIRALLVPQSVCKATRSHDPVWKGQ
jgi:hypothetical protein